VIVHGGWGGGWEWAAVARALREQDHDVFTPTLTGMGERAHLGGPEVGLATHVADVVALLELEDLREVVLCGHSFGGMPVSGAADLASFRIMLVIYIDALVPRDGQSAFDLLPKEFAERARSSAAEHGDGWQVPIPSALLPPRGWVADGERERYVDRVRPQPLASFAEAVRIAGALERLPRAFVRCTGGDLSEDIGSDPIAPFAARAQREGWAYRELDATHDPQLTDPTGTASILDELAASGR
jgi:pimeloyl-ACP methyl ester carboxylesterase